VCSLRRRVLDLRDAMREGEERNTLCGIVAVKGDNVCCAFVNSFNLSRFLDENSGRSGSFVSISNEYG